jgi:imidazolonepropionase
LSKNNARCNLQKEADCRIDKFDASCGIMKTLFKNIKGLVGTLEDSPAFIAGKDMKNFGVLCDSYLAIENGKIVDYGSMKDWPGISDWSDLEIIDAEGRYILPTWCDSHTHTVFAQSRALEFEDKINGLTYQEIAQRGGGIINSAKALSIKSEEELLKDALSRIQRMMQNGTGALEIKTGYGLDVANELKMLRVIHQIKNLVEIPIKITLLIAHALPDDYQNKMDDYVDHMIRHLLPQANELGFDFIDLFCERDYFQVHHLKQILSAAKSLGKKGKVHLNQFYSIGGISEALQHEVISLDHVEILSEEDIQALLKQPTIVTALPGCSLFTKIPYTPARKLMDLNIPVALATDFNPGSSPNGNMNLVNSLACIQMQMNPTEVCAASCYNGAAAMELQNELGSITCGKRANLIITEPLEHLSELFYYFGESRIESVWINGKKR